MKKVYLSLIGTLFSTALFAQEKQLPESEYTPGTAQMHNANTISNRAIIWSEDFGGGFPAAWATNDISGICPWKWSLGGSYGYYNGNTATAAGTAIASATAANGFLICDPDSANHATYGQPSGTTYQYLESYFITDAINLSGHPYVLLEFSQFFRYNNSVNLMVMVSTDSTNWTTYNVQGSATNNTASANAEQISLNISAVAGNQATVYLKIGWSARVYYWMIDDMAIVDAEADDLKLVNANFENNAPMTTGPNVKYTYVPTSQVAAIDFRADLVNNGYNTQSNSFTTVDVVDAGMTNYYTGTGTGTTMNPGDSLHDVVSSFAPAATVRDYDFIYNATYANSALDATPANNSDTLWMNVTANEYGRDNNTYSTLGLWNGAGQLFVLGNAYQIANTWTINGVKVAFSAGTDTGVVAYVTIYEIDPTDPNNFIPIVSTDGTVYEKTLVGSEISSAGVLRWCYFQIPPTTLLAGGEYIACVGHYGGADDMTLMYGGKSPAYSTFLYDGVTWFYTTNTPAIRLIYDASIGIDEEVAESGIQLHQNVPNPASENTVIRFKLPESAEVSFEISDITGKIVYAKNSGTLSAGENQISVDVSSMSTGMYFYSVIVNGEKLTKKFTVK